MNQEQIKMGMKISKKIAKKNNKNNKHGYDDEYYKNVLQEALKLPKDSDNKHYKDMIEIMKILLMMERLINLINGFLIILKYQKNQKINQRLHPNLLI